MNDNEGNIKDPLNTGSATIPSPFPEYGDGSGYTTYTNIRPQETAKPEDNNETLKALAEQLFEQNKQIAEQNKQIAARMDRIDKLLQEKEANEPYQQAKELSQALNPNRKKAISPLEEVRILTAGEANKKAEEFASQVKKEDILNNPLNPLHPSHVPPLPQTPPPLPQTPPPLPTMEQQKDIANPKIKKAALIAGIITGGTVGILAGSAIAGPAAIACAAVSGVSQLTNYIGSKRIAALERKKSFVDEAEKAKIDKRINNWQKVRAGCQYIAKFFGGAALGFGAANAISTTFMGGDGVIDKIGFKNASAGTENIIGHNNPASHPTTSHSLNGEAVHTGTTPMEVSPTESTYDLFADGHINLEGSAMDGWRIADIPEYYKGMPLEDIPANQFMNSGSKAFQIFLRDLQANGISNEALNAIPKPVLHQALADGAYNQTDILSRLQDMGYLKP